MSRVILHTNIEAWVKDGIAAESSRQNRSLANLVETVLMDYVLSRATPAASIDAQNALQDRADDALDYRRGAGHDSPR